MNDFPLSPDDPKLTAYALGELSGAEHAEIEAAVRRSPELQTVVAEIRGAVEQLESALADEAAMPLEAPLIAFAANEPEAPGALVEFAPAAETDEDPAPVNSRARGEMRAFPSWRVVIGGLAAACLAVLVTLREQPSPPASEALPAPKKAEQVANEIVSSEPPRTAETGVAEEAVSPAPAADAETVLAAATQAPALAASDAPLSLQEQAERAGNAPEISETLRVGGDGIAYEEARAAASSLEGVQGEVGVDEFAATVPLLPPAPMVTVSNLAALGTRAPLPTPAPFSGTTPDSGEVVTLSTVVVEADRVTGFAGRGRGVDVSKRPGPERSELPFPPAGAKFGRNRDAYRPVPDNPFQDVAESPFATFGIEVAATSYSTVRRLVEEGRLPSREVVRVEELVNYFPYGYAAPKGDAPIAASLEVAAAPWAPQHKLVRVGLRARDLPARERPPANLVFLLDVSASMAEANKLPLVQESLRVLLGKLRGDDRVAIVTYAGTPGVALASTPVSQTQEIVRAIEGLTSGGPATGASGIQLAYEQALRNFQSGGINRVIVCTDGDFNLGQGSEAELVRLIEEKAAAGVSLSVLGFGPGSYRDATLEKLADRGSGSFGYIDTRRDAERLLAQQVGGLLVTMAKDVKIQVDFNPAKVARYRLIGYENQLLKRDDFNRDDAEAGDIGAGQTITALFEIVPVGVDRAASGTAADDSRYAVRGAVSSRLEAPINRRATLDDELLTVKVRLKKPGSFLFNWGSTLVFPLLDAEKSFARASADFRFAAAVAAYGMTLRDSPYRGQSTVEDVVAWSASAAREGDDPGGYRSEFVELARKTQRLLRDGNATFSETSR